MDELLALESSFSVVGEEFSDEAQSVALEDSVMEVQSKHQCSMCNFETLYLSNLRRHVRVQHEEKGPSCSSINKTFLCSHCGKSYRSKYGLDLHVKDVHKQTYKYQCPVCFQQYNTLWNYKGHMASHETTLREKCPNCNSTFQYRRSLLRHQLSCPKNSSSRQYLCVVCGSQFSSNDALKEHNMRKHEKMAVKCKKCQKEFKWRSSLHYHLKKCYQEKISMDDDVPSD